MPKFTAGDEVEINGQKWIVRSWPVDDEGPFFATRDHDGAQQQATFYAGQVREDIDEEAPVYEVKATGKAVGVPNTAGEVPVDPEDPPVDVRDTPEFKAALAAALAEQASPAPVKAVPLAKKAPAKKAPEPEPKAD